MKNEILMVPVKSSLITKVGYDTENEVLAITFEKGGTWHYQNIDSEVFDAFTKSDSIGKFFLQFLKNNPNYPCAKCDDEPKQELEA